jgi:hypothetical protein
MTRDIMLVTVECARYDYREIFARPRRTDVAGQS